VNAAATHLQLVPRLSMRWSLAPFFQNRFMVRVIKFIILEAYGEINYLKNKANARMLRVWLARDDILYHEGVVIFLDR